MTGDPMHCDRCGQPHTAGCVGHRRDGAPCGNQPMSGQTVCRMHGGAAPQARAAAERRQAEAAAERVLRAGLAAAYGDDVPPMAPSEAMLRAVSWKYAEVVWLRGKVAELDEHSLVWGVVRDKSGGDDYGVTQEARPNAWLSLLHEAERDLVKFSAAAEAAGCDRVRVEIEKQKAELVVVSLRNALQVVPLLPADRDLALRTFLSGLGRGAEGAVAVAGEVTA